MMNATNIASAHILDIVFDGRNKDFGAYQLQRNYTKRMTLAMTIVLAFCALVFVLGMRSAELVIGNPIPKPDSLTFVNVELVKPEPVIVIPKRKAQPQQVAQTQFTEPLIVRRKSCLKMYFRQFRKFRT